MSAISSWVNMIIGFFEQLFNSLSHYMIAQGFSVLDVIIAAAIMGMLLNTFISRGRS